MSRNLSLCNYGVAITLRCYWAFFISEDTRYNKRKPYFFSLALLSTGLPVTASITHPGTSVPLEFLFFELEAHDQITRSRSPVTQSY